MTFYYTLINERKHLENKIINIKKILETIPKENLKCARNNKKAQRLLHASRILVHIFYTVLFSIV